MSWSFTDWRYKNHLDAVYATVIINPIQDEGGKKRAYKRFPCNFYKRRISPRNFLTFSCYPFDILL